MTRIPTIVDEACSRFPMPRPATLKMFREAVWAIAQHYSLWPTPLIDVTPNLRVAASFALWTGDDEGNLYVVALPPSTNSVTYDADQHVVLARLQAVFPPEAKRPHFQDGYLVGRFPFESPTPNRIDHRPREVSNLRRRLVARIVLKNKTGAEVDEPSRRSFWNPDFPPMSAASLTPSTEVDKLLKQFIRYAEEIDDAMRNICSANASPAGYNPGYV
jgi:FRG domain